MGISWITFYNWFLIHFPCGQKTHCVWFHSFYNDSLQYCGTEYGLCGCSWAFEKSMYSAAVGYSVPSMGLSLAWLTGASCGAWGRAGECWLKRGLRRLWGGKCSVSWLGEFYQNKLHFDKGDLKHIFQLLLYFLVNHMPLNTSVRVAHMHRFYFLSSRSDIFTSEASATTATLHCLESHQTPTLVSWSAVINLFSLTLMPIFPSSLPSSVMLRLRLWLPCQQGFPIMSNLLKILEGNGKLEEDG